VIMSYTPVAQAERSNSSHFSEVGGVSQKTCLEPQIKCFSSYYVPLGTCYSMMFDGNQSPIIIISANFVVSFSYSNIVMIMFHK